MKKTIVMTLGGIPAAWLRRRLWSAVAILVILIFTGSLLSSRVGADDDTHTSTGRLITLHDRGVEQTFMTTATTVGGALEEAGVEIDARDRVEPAVDESLVADEYAVNVYRARPLLVVDGSLRKVVMTAAQVSSQIADDAEITLYDEDITAFEQSDDLLADHAAERFVVYRATSFEFTLYGETYTARTQADTVGGMLAEKDITLGEKDRVSVDADTPITEGMKLRVWREGKQTITVDETIEFETEQIQDANREVGYTQVRTEGEDGQASVTYEVTIQDGKEVSRKKISSVTKKAAVKQVEVIGVKVTLPPGSHQDWMASAGISSSDYGYVNAIFAQESGWNPAAANPNGLYYGLGQTSLDRLQGACGATWASDPICQIGVFDSYAKGRYGTWKAAYEFKFGSGGSSGAGWW